MAPNVYVLLDDTDGGQLVAIAGDRSHPLKYLLRARIVLLSASRLSVQDVARQASGSQAAVWRWQQRYGEEGIEGLLCNKTRPPGITPHSVRTVAEILALTCSDSPDGVTQWTHRAVAGQIGFYLHSVQRIWHAHR